MKLLTCIFCLILLVPQFVQAQKGNRTISYQISLPEADKHLVHVTMHIPKDTNNSWLVKLPKWTTGYYQLMNYDKNISNLIISANGRSVTISAEIDHTTFP